MDFKVNTKQQVVKYLEKLGLKCSVNRTSSDYIGNIQIEIEGQHDFINYNRAEPGQKFNNIFCWYYEESNITLIHISYYESILDFVPNPYKYVIDTQKEIIKLSNKCQSYLELIEKLEKEN